MRKKFVAGNWKMFTTAASAKQLAAAVVKGLGAEDRVTVMLAPPFPVPTSSVHMVTSRVTVFTPTTYPS